MKAFCYDETMKNLVLAVSPDSSLKLLKNFADIVILDKEWTVDSSVSYGTVYIRSHFGQPATTPENFRKEIETIVQVTIAKNPNILFVDSIKDVDDILTFEDKWNQFTRFGALMPRTELYNNEADVASFRQPIFKKRLSSRGVGVTWDRSNANPSKNDWLIQESLDIREELRIYILRGDVYPVCAVKESMKEGGRSQAVQIRDLILDEIKFAQKVANKAPSLDFVGLDVAVTHDGSLKLMEVNRSPGFAKFKELAGVNLAQTLYDKFEVR